MQVEKAHLGTFRYHRAGTKRCVITSEAAALSFMKAKHPGTQPSLQQVWDFFRKVASDAPLLELFLQHQGQDKLWYGTCRPHDVLYLPACHLVIEEITGAKIGSGVKWHTITPQDEAPLQAVCSQLEAAPGPKASSLPLLQDATRFAGQLEKKVIGTLQAQAEEASKKKQREEQKAAAAAAKKAEEDAEKMKMEEAKAAKQKTEEQEAAKAAEEEKAKKKKPEGEKAKKKAEEEVVAKEVDPDIVLISFLRKRNKLLTLIAQQVHLIPVMSACVCYEFPLRGERL